MRFDTTNKVEAVNLIQQITSDFPGLAITQSFHTPVNKLELEVIPAEIPQIRICVIGSPVTVAPFDRQIEMMLEWASSRASRFVCVANVHMLIEAYWHPEFHAVLARADLVTPDGMPLVWMMKLMGAQHQNRIAGLDIMLSICQQAPQRQIKVFFLGSEASILEQMRKRLECEFPTLEIAGMEPLPFRPLTKAEDAAVIQKIHDSGAGIVLLALGCPKQEYWMDRHKDKIHAVTIGVGGVFPVYAGIHKRAPLWMRNFGLEWFYRLVQEPRRLWKRYTTTMPLFIWLALKQLLTQGAGSREQ
ncbi:MAG: N-acetylglucosaminyldiphosphoundecaprenol N-acetyl-beta-D-mannosaminyltransferase [Chroococcidiopsis sp. SAG 2025]|uniref:WecB/TagA/CpsF family glycosyltransferase n=1 Tax=Chroococcidiopsis sp. SAG 2025 TaxID=171389 RepID=UPI0029372E0E|nr:WecB/TagA/CpsF family glycosyltransferase [Chroococcidiopsis sp. SAG 2025]MDV2996190.1 N-acetylglucosaminyldiphosphoundecaprenol N-acetyl-beta-D-mannosaminyltransferase [Chroococcidiopsis sp. SAG 2025]